MNILGISAYYHDAAACLLRDGEIVAAAQEERFSRRKHDASFPSRAIQYCLKEGKLGGSGLDAVAFYDKPFIKFERIMESYLAFAPRGLASFLKAIPLWMRKKLWVSDAIRKELDFEGPILFPEHHESHAASAFFPSPFSGAAILTVDGVGEWATASCGVGRQNEVQILQELHYPHSLGLLYSAFTYFTGFKVNSGEYKLMGLAPYGEPTYAQKIYDQLIDLKGDGSFRLNMQYFDYGAGLTMTNSRFAELFDGPPRQPESAITAREMNLASSIQIVTEEIVLRMARHLKKETGEQKLCLAGGVALNCVANGKLKQSGLFDDIWIQPAAGDAGGAVGAAYIAYHHHFEKERGKPPANHFFSPYLGPRYGRDEILAFLGKNGVRFHERGESELVQEVANLLARQKVVGWFQGRMEFGPRALGSRSILGDPRSPEMQRKINLKIKFRESFRPFAPSVLHEAVSDWFEFEGESPYMLFTAPVASKHRMPPGKSEENLSGLERVHAVRSTVPAITHLDYSARLQTVAEEQNPLFYRLLTAFAGKTGCPLLVNTSFNVRGEPIVASPEDAYRCFMRTDMDALALENFLLLKEEQPEQKVVHREELPFELD